ncbi:MAG: preprotein translocase subunit SecE [Lachnospiraceae bacterium]|nr:preprotein translocase subunit SecE [Lachnospiraceae bacterium]
MSDTANDKAAPAAGAPAAAAAAGGGLKEFFAGVKQEFKKIIWPNRPTLISRSTCVVIVSICLGAIIAVIDRLILYIVNFLVK